MNKDQIFKEAKAHPFQVIRVKDDQDRDFLVLDSYPVVQNSPESFKGKTTMATNLAKEDEFEHRLQDMQDDYKSMTGKSLEDINWSPIIINKVVLNAETLSKIK